MPTSYSSSSGFTIVELLMAMLITVVGLLALLTSINLASEQNVKTQLRTEAISVGEERMRHMQAIPFASMSTALSGTYTYAPQQVQSRLRGISKQYTVITTVGPLQSNSRAVGVRVGWSYKNMSSSHQTLTMRTGDL